MSHDEQGRLLQIGEGDIMAKVLRDRQRFGPLAVIRIMSANEFFKDKDIPVRTFLRDQYMVYNPADLHRRLREVVGKYVHLEISWRKR